MQSSVHSYGLSRNYFVHLKTLFSDLELFINRQSSKAELYDSFEEIY